MLHADPFAIRELLGPDAAPGRRAITGEHGVVLPGFCDHHVHLHLIEEGGLAAHGIAAAVDLGGDPVALARRPIEGFPRLSYAGAFLTAPGGYPVGRPWAPQEITREVSDLSTHPGVPGGAATAVDEQASCGASVIKVALNSTAGPVFDLETLSAIVACAHARGLPVVAHVEGEGMTRLALDAEVDALAHTPFSERLDGATIARAVAVGQRWISTLTIHEGVDAERAAINLVTFVRTGGRVLYGTDLGNGDRTVGIQPDELAALDAAGVRGAGLIAALSDPWPASEAPPGIASFVPGDPPASLDDIPAWLGAATVVPDEEVVRDDP
jgi:imidazolonepropionase-like amidohydrolase